jgi:hypothetical protein
MDTYNFKVYHKISDEFVCVADVQVHLSDCYKLEDALEKVYELTNHIDKNWAENDCVTAHGNPEKLRSTMVGDRIEECSLGKTWRVCDFGFTEVS